MDIQCTHGRRRSLYAGLWTLASDVDARQRREQTDTPSGRRSAAFTRAVRARAVGLGDDWLAACATCDCTPDADVVAWIAHARAIMAVDDD